MKADESKRQQGVDQQLQLREQLLKTGEVQRQLMALQVHLNGEVQKPKRPLEHVTNILEQSIATRKT